MEDNLGWEAPVEEKFKALIAKMPVFLRGIAEQKIFQRAEGLVREAGRDVVTEKDLIDALFAETPFGFQGLMKNDLSDLGVDYTKYGYTR